MTTQAQMAETIAEVTELKALELYRECDANTYGGVNVIDHHMVDLSKRIIGALGLLPKSAEQLASELKPTENEPVKELGPDIGNMLADAVYKAADLIGDMLTDVFQPQEPDQEENTQKGLTTEKTSVARNKAVDDSPSGGGDVHTTDDKQPPDRPPAGQDTHTDASGAEESDASKPASGGKLGSPKRHSIADEIEAWLEAENLSNNQAGKFAKVSDVTIGSILAGKTLNPGKATKKKIRTAIKKSIKPKKKRTTHVKPPASAKPAGEAKLNGKGPGQFVQLKLTAWMDSEHLGINEAANRLRVMERTLRLIKLDGVLPHQNIIRQLARHIPAIEEQQAMLLAAAKQS